MSESSIGQKLRIWRRANGIKQDAMLAIGIGGSQTALNEFTKPTPTGFFGTVLISPKRHGYETAVFVYEWATAGKAPPPVTLTAGTLMTRQNQFDNISKVFPGVKALNGVSFEAHAGQVMGLLGENGAGKSTLVKCAMGYYAADQGQILLNDHEVEIAHPRQAHELGL
eukprot:gene9608-11787_t